VIVFFGAAALNALARGFRDLADFHQSSIAK
jgi:hypothetical protein